MYVCGKVVRGNSGVNVNFNEPWFCQRTERRICWLEPVWLVNIDETNERQDIPVVYASTFDRRKEFLVICGHRPCSGIRNVISHRRSHISIIGNVEIEISFESTRGSGRNMFKFGARSLRGASLYLETKTTTGSERLIGHLIRSAAVLSGILSSVSARRNLIDNLFSEPLISRCFKRGGTVKTEKWNFNNEWKAGQCCRAIGNIFY